MPRSPTSPTAGWRCGSPARARATCWPRARHLDLHPRAFPPGRCAGTLLAKAAVLIHLLDDDPGRGPSFDVYVARSFAHYLWTWLEDAGREYGVAVEPAP